MSFWSSSDNTVAVVVALSCNEAPVDGGMMGRTSSEVLPVVSQVFLARDPVPSYTRSRAAAPSGRVFRGEHRGRWRR